MCKRKLCWNPAWNDLIDKLGKFKYECPIQINTTEKIASSLREAEEQYIIRYLQNMQIIVDKDELIKALQYDRDQYQKGYRDAISRETSSWELYDGLEPRIFRCKRCQYFAWVQTNYCPRCGAIMLEVHDDATSN